MLNPAPSAMSNRSSAGGFTTRVPEPKMNRTASSSMRTNAKVSSSWSRCPRSYIRRMNPASMNTPTSATTTAARTTPTQKLPIVLFTVTMAM